MARKSKKISFPNYESKASEPVKMYLAGDFGENAKKINPYPVSTMYAIDRYASYMTDWKKDYEDNSIIVTDRYTTSNMVHQASKIDDKQQKKDYLNWLKDLEYEKMGIPVPDLVIFLNMPTEMARKLMENRKNKITGEEKKDIHEKDKDHLKEAYENACEIAKKDNWKEVTCVRKDGLKTIDEIAEEVYRLVEKII
ncbi:MAG: deoxynucleoside kinase [Mycoplasmataceae bacterium]|nr:deoxynucleoside kinase [Mycoplasmataceae bacterium]